MTQRERTKIWRENNPDEHKKRVMKSREKNIENYREYMREYMRNKREIQKSMGN